MAMAVRAVPPQATTAPAEVTVELSADVVLRPWEGSTTEAPVTTPACLVWWRPRRHRVVGRALRPGVVRLA